jgi:isovaleryl-CoA dehydrogenase
MPSVVRIAPLKHDDADEKCLHALGQRIRQRKAECAERRVLDLESWRELAALGFWRRPVPRSLGGEGGSWRDFGNSVRLLAAYGNDLGFMLSVIAHAGVVRLLLTWGTEEQKRTHLARLCDGMIGATAITEAHAGSDIQNVSTRATPIPEGFSIVGEKVHITNGPSTDIFLLVCKTPGNRRKDISLFIIDADTPGVICGESESMMGNATSPTGPITLRDVRVGCERLVGTPGEGLRILYRTIELDRALYAVAAAGLLENVLEESLSYCQSRMAFSKPIVENQYVQHRLTDIKIAMETSRALGFGALAKIDLRDPESVLLSALAKLVATESLVAAAEHFMILHGHAGYEQGRIASFMADALATRIAGGTSDIQRVAIFDQIMRTRRKA